MGRRLIDDEVNTDVEQLIQGLGKAVEEAVDAAPPSTPVQGASPSQYTLSGTLEEGADLLLQQLSPAIRDYAFEVADQVLHIPRWQLVLGSMLAQYEGGNLSTPATDPSWSAETVRQSSAICAFCLKPFQPERFKQTFCSQTCGTAARKKEIEGRNAAKQKELDDRRRMAQRERDEREVRESA